jgi:hypothetical protein
MLKILGCTVKSATFQATRRLRFVHPCHFLVTTSITSLISRNYRESI